MRHKYVVTAACSYMPVVARWNFYSSFKINRKTIARGVDMRHLPGSSSFVLIGHSTGCQDAVFYMQHGRPDLAAKVRGVVLQVCTRCTCMLGWQQQHDATETEAPHRLHHMGASYQYCILHPSYDTTTRRRLAEAQASFNRKRALLYQPHQR